MVGGHSTVIRAGTLIDGTGADPVHDVYISIVDGVIDSVAKDVPASGHGDISDASDLTVLPGLIDCHVHLCSDPVPDIAARALGESEAMTVIRGGAQCKEDAAIGCDYR